MKKRNKLLILFLLLLIAYVAHILISNGFFRTVTPQFEGQILQEIKLPGAEDMMVSRVDSFLLVSSTNRAVYPPLDEEEGGLYLIDLKSKSGEYTPIHLSANFDKPFAPHGISMVKTDSTYTVMAINHTLNGRGRIYTIGDWNNIARVRIGASIKKHGARTGYTTGNVTRIANIRVRNRWFRHVYETSRRFGCPGDSGSAVIDSNNNWIGIYSWGEDLGENTCSKNPKGYFWAIDPASQLLEFPISIGAVIR